MTIFNHIQTRTGYVVPLFDGYKAYLLIVDKYKGHTWVFLTELKDPPTNTVIKFMDKFDRKDGGMVKCDQEGELARSDNPRNSG